MKGSVKNGTLSMRHATRVVRGRPEAKTYDEWQAEGFQVRKGQKATGRNKEGKATFLPSQVDYIPDEEFDEDDHQQFMDEYGYDRDWM